MLMRVICILLCLFLANRIEAGEPSLAKHLAFVASIEGELPACGQPIRLPLPRQLIALTRRDFADLRLFDDIGVEIPYVIYDESADRRNEKRFYIQVAAFERQNQSLLPESETETFVLCRWTRRERISRDLLGGMAGFDNEVPAGWRKPYHNVAIGDRARPNLYFVPKPARRYEARFGGSGIAPPAYDLSALFSSDQAQSRHFVRWRLGDIRPNPHYRPAETAWESAWGGITLYIILSVLALGMFFWLYRLARSIPPHNGAPPAE